ncbi:MAG: hypothetical protein H6703_16445 [Myxococcales bacterium]|nr:hypothetical protein [Myxococcales bacterium]
MQNAERFKQLLNSLEPEKPLSDLNLYVEGRRSAAREIERRLDTIEKRPCKSLLLGARGGGKSTELRRLVSLLAGRSDLIVETIDLDATGVTAANVTALDLLYMCCIALLRRVAEKPQKLLFTRLKAAYAGEQEKGTLGKVADALEGLRGFGMALGGAAGAAVGEPGALAVASAGVMDVMAKGITLIPRPDRFVSESSTQGQRMLAVCTEITQAVRGDRAVSICLVVDGLEKMNGEANDRFHAMFEQTRLIAQAPWSMVIAAPPSTLTSGDSVANLGYDTVIVWGFPDEPELLTRLVRRRLAAEGLADDVIDADALDYMVAMCGGLPRHLVKILEETLWAALAQEADRLTMAVVKAGVRRFGMELARGLDLDDIEVLSTVKRRRRLPKRDESAKLFAAGRILAEPPDGDGLFNDYRVHPILAPEIE